MSDDPYDDINLDGDDDTESEPENPGEQRVTLTRSQIRAMERDAKAARKAVAEADSARKELAFIKAGLDLDTPLGKFFAEKYDGPMEAAEIQKAYSELSGVAQAKPEDEPTPQEIQGSQERQSLAAGAIGDNGVAPPEDAQVAAVSAGRMVLERGGSREEAMGTYFSEVVGRAAEGDPSVVITPGREVYEG